MQSETAKTGELEKARVLEPTIITTADDFRASRAKWVQSDFHVLTPIADFRALPPHYGLMPAQVKIDTSLTSGDVYQDNVFTKGDEVALTKLGLNKIALAAGMSVRTERTDPRTIPNYWEVRATATFVGIDGTAQSFDATEEFDLRDGTARYDQVMKGPNGPKPKMLQQQREKGLRHCEARAINAAIRQFGLKQKYTKKELEKPFVVLRVHFIPDMTDPDVKRFITERALAGTTALYGRTATAERALPEPEHLGTLGVGGEVDDATMSDATAVVLVSDVTPKSGVTPAKDGKPARGWTVYRVSFSDGRYGGTFDTKLAEKAAKARDEKTGVRLAVIDDSGKNPNLTKLELVTDEQDVALPLEMPDLNGPDIKL